MSQRYTQDDAQERKSPKSPFTEPLGPSPLRIGTVFCFVLLALLLGFAHVVRGQTMRVNVNNTEALHKRRV